MRGVVARIFSTLLGGLIGFLASSLIYSSYSQLFATWEVALREAAGTIPPQFQEAVELEEARALLSRYINILMVSGFAIGYFFTPVIEIILGRLTILLANVARRTTKQKFIVTSQGVFAGVLLSILLINVPLFYYLTTLPGGVFSHPFVMALIHVLVAMIFGYGGGFLASAVFYPQSSRESILAQYDIEPKPRILDTSVLIDGRIIEILKTGFLPGLLVIPKAVVRELQQIADSPDQIKRNKGRRGLDLLKGLESSVSNPVHFYDDTYLDSPRTSVDDILIEVASELGGEVITNDYNLNKVAAIRKVTVLNINELVNAVKPMLLPGESLTVNIIRHGKEPGQGVGYLEDGTMVVVEAGEHYIGHSCELEVTSVMQTAAGRLIFGKINRVVGVHD